MAPLLLFALFCIPLAYALQGEPAQVTLLIRAGYRSEQDGLYRGMVADMIRTALTKYDITYNANELNIHPRSSFGRLAIDIWLDADCMTLPGFVKEMMTESIRVRGAAVKCGPKSNIIYVNNDQIMIEENMHSS
ncbi:hypothetical protein Y032_0008g100 [Ancylostoma ceylanicum]|nr:hypothetical protein Y032_0008g100 [Ancylostoma ceylanicum]